MSAQQEIHHGRTAAAWTGVVIAFVGFIIGAIGVLMLNLPIIIIAGVVLLLAAVVGGIMHRLGKGQPTYGVERPSVAELRHEPEHRDAIEERAEQSGTEQAETEAEQAAGSR